MMKSISRAVVFLVAAFAALANAGNAQTADSLPEPAPTRTLQFTTDEGSWISLDVSPDGRTIVFDLLGDLYTILIEGGTATRITSGPGWDAAPRFSPDGQHILFTSDRSGSDHIWTMAADGSAPTRITTNDEYQHTVPAWAPDGKFIALLRTVMRDENPKDELVYMHTGGGSGRTLVSSRGRGPVFSADGRWFYYSIFMYGQARDEIRRIDRRSGEDVRIVSGYPELYRPMPSRDGRLLAFGALIDGERVLVVRDLETRKDRILYRGLDELVAWGDRDLDRLPGYAFTPDGGAIVFAADGRIRRVNIASGETTIIPFTAHVDQTIAELVYFEQSIDDGPVKPRVLHWAQPAGADRFIFVAAGKVYVYHAQEGFATPLVDGPDPQFAPAVSPDGQWVAFVAWNDTLGAEILKAPLAGGSPVRLSQRRGRYQNLSWSNDGKRIAVAEQIEDLNHVSTLGYKLLWLDAESGGPLHWIRDSKPRRIRKAAPRKTFDASGERIYYSEADSGSWELWSVKLDGTGPRRIAKSKRADEMIPSPDGRWLAFTERQDVYITPLPSDVHETLNVQGRDGAFPVYRLSTEGGDYIHWIDGGRTIAWSWGNRISRIDLARATAGGTPTPTSVTVEFEIPRAKGRGDVLLANARIITMKGDEVIERGDLLVRNARIVAVGPSGTLQVPADTRTFDMTGKTIVPGFIDLHAHYAPSGSSGSDVYPAQNPELLANLAYGVTTWRDPSARAQSTFALAELVETGRTLGPRIFGTGDLFWALDYVCCGPPDSLDQARARARRMKALGATTLKEKGQTRRQEVQWLVQAAREEGLLLASDPARGPRRELRTIMDGFTTFEHLYAAKPMKKDVIELFVQSGVTYVPTVYVSVAEHFVTEWEHLHDDAKARRFIPHFRLEREMNNHLELRLPHDRPLPRYVKEIGDLVRAGGKVGLGSHGQIQGLGAHFELWMMASGGLTPLEALRSATIVGAEALGLKAHLGSLEPGKLADLIVLNENPLDDLHHTTAIAYVMKGGILWEADTLNEVWPNRRVRPRGAWEVRDPILPDP